MKSENPYNSSIRKFLQAIADNEGLLYSIDQHLNHYHKKLKESTKNRDPEDFLMGTSYIIGDISGNSDNGWKINYPTKYGTEIRIKMIDEHFHKLREREAELIVALSFESFQALLYDILATFIAKNNIEKISNVSINLSTGYKSIRERIRNTIKGTNSSKIVDALKNSSDTFKEVCNQNHLLIDLSDFVYVLSEVRQAIIHNKGIIKKAYLNGFNNHKEFILKKYFKPSFIEEGASISLGHSEANKILEVIGEVGFQVYKSFSKDLGVNWKILQKINLPKNP